jgi:hypothetical protein
LFVHHREQAKLASTSYVPGGGLVVDRIWASRTPKGRITGELLCQEDYQRAGQQFGELAIVIMWHTSLPMSAPDLPALSMSQGRITGATRIPGE